MHTLAKLLTLSTSYDGSSMDAFDPHRMKSDGELPTRAHVQGSSDFRQTDLTQSPPVWPDPTVPPMDDQAVIELLITEHSPAMFRVAKSVVRDTALAEDVVQESLLKAWQAVGSFRGESSMRSWLLRITQNTAISMLRKRREDFRDPVQMPEVIDLVGQTDRQAAGRAMVTDLWAALGDLDQVSRTIIVLRELEGLTYEEISDVLDLPLPTIKTRLFRSRRTLAAVLEEWR